MEAMNFHSSTFIYNRAWAKYFIKKIYLIIAKYILLILSLVMAKYFKKRLLVYLADSI